MVLSIQMSHTSAFSNGLFSLSRRPRTGSYSTLASCTFSNLFSVKGRDSKEEWWQLFSVNNFPAVIKMGINLSHVEHTQQRLLEWF